MNAETLRTQRKPDYFSSLRALRLCVLSLAAGVGLAMGAAPTFAEEELSPAEHVARANQALADGDFENALADYRQAELALPESPDLAYNQGIVHYRTGDFAKARELFSRALTTRDLELEAKVKFNLGNCRYAEALEKMSNLQEAIDHLRTAIEYYVDVLEIAPEDADARANIETAQLLIKDLLDKLKNQQEQQPQDPTSQPSECDQKEQQEGQQEQQSQDGDEQQEPEEQENQQEQQQQAGEDEQQTQQEQSEPPAGEQEERQLTEEEARRLLQAVRDKEQQRRDEQARRRRIGRAKVAKDW